MWDFFLEAHPERNPCMPSPCGPNTYCQISGKRAICTCIENFIGDPKRGCRPECTMNSDCPSNKVCTRYQCKDPCSVSNVCGLGAVCLCRDHNPTCVCREGFAGNPFVQCLPRREYPFCYWFIVINFIATCVLIFVLLNFSGTSTLS